MKQKIFKYLLTILSLWLFLSSGTIVWAGFGISPAGITLTDVLRGTEIQKSIVLSRNDPKEDLLVEAIPEGVIADWIQLERGNKFTYPAGNKQFPVGVLILIPKNTPNGDYEGKIRFSATPQRDCEDGSCVGSSVGIATGALADIKVKVTDRESKSFRVLGMQVDRAMTNEKLVLILFLENNGNVDIEPDHIVVDLFDKFHKMQLGSFTVSSFEGKVSPQNTGTTRVTIPWIPDRDNYWAEISVFDHKNQLVAKENLAFEAEGDGELGAYLKEKNGGINKTLLIVLIAIGGGLLLLGLGFFFMSRYLKKMLANHLPINQPLENNSTDPSQEVFIKKGFGTDNLSKLSKKSRQLPFLKIKKKRKSLKKK